MHIETKTSEEWSIGIYRMTFSSGAFKFFPYKRIRNPVLTSKNITGIEAEYVADPFLVRKNGNYYMFFEAMIENKGCIGLAKSKDASRWKYEKIILDEPFHLSYPHVFNWNETYYMIPETYMKNSIRLYESTEFPYKWGFKKTLVEGKEFVDPTLLRYKGKWWLFVSNVSNEDLYLYYADDLEGDWKEHPRSPIIKKDPKIARPAGNIIQAGDRLIRIAQNDFLNYGNSLYAFEILELNEKEYMERGLEGNPLLEASGKGWNKDGMHHLSGWRINDKEWIVSVDGKNIRIRYRLQVYIPEKIVKIFRLLKIFK